MRVPVRHSLYFVCLAAILLGVTTPTVDAMPTQHVPHIPGATSAPSVLETPVIVSEDFNEWTIGGGFVYWGLRCHVGPLDSTPQQGYYLRRQPSGGGDIRTLATVGENDCETFVGMAADDSGVYYYNAVDDRIEMFATDSPDSSPFIVDASVPSVVAGLALDESYVYWATGSDTIRRAAKDGSGTITLINTNAFTTDLVVDDTHVYWLDSTGLWWASKDCSTPPCAKEHLSTTTGDHLLLGEFGLAGEPRFVYWVRTSDPQRIVRLDCLPGCMTVVLHTATSGWDLGQLVSARIVSFPPPFPGDTHLFWTEKYFPSEGRVRRMPIGGGSPDDIAITSASVDKRLFKDTLGLYFGDCEPGNETINRLPFNASALERDLSAEAWEVTQAIQNLTNEVPLVADKETYVRVYGGQVSGPQANAAEAWLEGTRDGLPLPGSPLQPAMNGVQALTTSSTFKRAKSDHGWLFRLPNSWTEADTITLQAVVDPRETYPDPDRTNNTLSGMFTFNHEPDACLFFWPVRTHMPLPSYSDPNFWETIDRSTSLWPVPATRVIWIGEPIEELEICLWGPVPYPCYGPYELGQGWDWNNWPTDSDRLMGKLILRQFAVLGQPLLLQNCEAGSSIHSVGMVHPDSDTNNINGRGNYYVNASWVKFPPHTWSPGIKNKWSTLVHELTHNLNRRHVDCPIGIPDDVDDGYTYTNTCKLDDRGPTAETTHFGFDSIRRKPVAPYAAADFMSYASYCWVSDYTYKAAMAEFGLRAATDVQTSAAGLQPSQFEDMVIVSGGFEPNLYLGRLDYAYKLPTSAFNLIALQHWRTLAAPKWVIASGDHDEGVTYNAHIRLKDATGNVLDDREVTLIEPAAHGDVFQLYTFVTTFPAPAGTVARLELLVGEDVLDVLKPGTGQPSVTVLAPGAGAIIGDGMTIRWSGNDPDIDDILLYNVEYSPDQGENWFPLVTNYPDTPLSDIVELTLNSPEAIPGSDGQNGLIRVTASDGYNTAMATSALFTVADRSPHAFITAPQAQQWTMAGETILLRGAALDAEDGFLDDDKFNWTVDGVANGSGREQLAAGLAPGNHDVELQVTDSEGQQAMAQSTFSISPLDVPQVTDAPSLDGLCDDEAYTGVRAVQLAPYSDGTQATVHLQRTADDLWLCFSGMDRGSSNPGTFAGIRVDVDNSQDSFAQTDDYGFFVGEDGTTITVSGDGQGSFEEPGPGGLSARVSATDTIWRAELRIDATILDGWEHLVGIALGHYGVTVDGDDYRWPYLALANQPHTWALTVLGDWPLVQGITPHEATLSSAAFTLTVTGTHFVDGTTAQWHDAPLPTTVVSSTQLTAEVNAARLATAGVVEVTAVAPGLEEAASPPQFFTINNPVPTVTNITPDVATMGDAPFTLTVEGSNFVDGAVVLWDGTELPTTLINSTQLQAAIGATDLVPPRTVTIRVLNPDPDEGASNAMTLAIKVPVIFLPIVTR